MSLVSFYNPGKLKKARDFLMFSWNIERISEMNWIKLIVPNAPLPYPLKTS